MRTGELAIILRSAKQINKQKLQIRIVAPHESAEEYWRILINYPKTSYL